MPVLLSNYRGLLLLLRCHSVSQKTKRVLKRLNLLSVGLRGSQRRQDSRYVRDCVRRGKEDPQHVAAKRINSPGGRSAGGVAAAPGKRDVLEDLNLSLQSFPSCQCFADGLPVLTSSYLTSGS